MLCISEDGYKLQEVRNIRQGDTQIIKTAMPEMEATLVSQVLLLLQVVREGWNKKNNYEQRSKMPELWLSLGKWTWKCASSATATQ